MISNLRNFAKTKIAKILIVIIIIPFVFWGMGGVFSSGSTNCIATINNYNISTQDLVDHLNEAGLDSKIIKENIDKAQNKIEKSVIVGNALATKMKKANIEKAIFDRNGYKYHGRIKAVCDSIRKKEITI